jgi:putative intracellular protease/amidase
MLWLSSIRPKVHSFIAMRTTKFGQKIGILLGFLVCLQSFAQSKKPIQSSDNQNIHKSETPQQVVKNIGVYVYDGFNTLDAIGSYQVLSELMSVNIFLIAKNKGIVKNQRGLEIKVDHAIADVAQLDILIIPGGAQETFLQTQDPEVLDWIRQIDRHTLYTASVCTGAWILGATGLLEGKKVSANWYRAEEIMAMYGAQYQHERYTRDGKYWTSAGVSAGIDMALGMVNALKGEKYTKAVLLDLEYDPRPLYPDGDASKTDPDVKEMMNKLYDNLLKSLIDTEKNKRASQVRPK